MNYPETGRRVIYLATPYTHKNRLIRQSRAKEAARIAGVLASRGVYVFAPVVPGHAMDYLTRPRIPYKYWIDFGLEMLARCDALYIAMMQGWYQSNGIHQEIAFAYSRDIPVLFLDPKGCTISEEFIERRKRNDPSRLETDRREPLQNNEDSALGGPGSLAYSGATKRLFSWFGNRIPGQDERGQRTREGRLAGPGESEALPGEADRD